MKCPGFVPRVIFAVFSGGIISSCSDAQIAKAVFGPSYETSEERQLRRERENEEWRRNSYERQIQQAERSRQLLEDRRNKFEYAKSICYQLANDEDVLKIAKLIPWNIESDSMFSDLDRNRNARNTEKKYIKRFAQNKKRCQDEFISAGATDPIYKETFDSLIFFLSEVHNGQMKYSELNRKRFEITISFNENRRYNIEEYNRQQNERNQQRDQLYDQILGAMIMQRFNTQANTSSHSDMSKHNTISRPNNIYKKWMEDRKRRIPNRTFSNCTVSYIGGASFYSYCNTELR